MRREIFPGAAAPPVAPDPPGWTQTTMATDEGDVEVWFRRGAGRSSESPGPGLLFAHGNAETVGDWLPFLDGYAERGISVVTVEYRGYGRSAGTATEDHLVRDATRGFDLLAAHPAVDPRRITLHGRSIGVGVVCGAARHRPARALIVQSGFTSLPDVAWEQSSIPPFLVLDRFDNVETLRSQPIPVLVLHGQDDEVFGLDHARQLVHAAGERAELKVYRCGHDDCDLDAMMRDIAVFIEQTL